jgi:cell division protein FtsI/penicillin-binding protein 2/cell division protein FtsW (lipid II flippase)
VAVTRSWSTTVEVTQPAVAQAVAFHGLGILWLICASLFIAAGLASVYAAKVRGFGDTALTVNVNAVQSPEELLPVLEQFPASEREAVAAKTFDYIARHRPLPNVGALSRVLPLRKLKSLLVVRTPREFQREFLLWCSLYFAGFYVVALAWRLRRFRGDRALLTGIQLLTGIGLMLMLSMRDPLRDTLEFRKFAIGVAIGCLLLAVPFDYRRLSDWCYTPLFAAIGLFSLLLKFGRGPGGTDIKVNLGPFQPVELIKILLVLFLAGYFTRNWERLRDLREKRIARKLFERIGAPRAEHIIPVALAVAGAVLFFFVLKDLGPALVTFFVFLAMYAASRGKAWLALAGVVALVGSVAIGYRMGQPHTVVDRIDMWLAPWDNNVHGGDQLAHGLWAFSTGGPLGSGPGWGDPEMIPAGNTDLVLPAIGEEWGFTGVAAIGLLFGFLVWRSLRAAKRAGTHFGFFLGLGLASLIAFEMLLISSGVLGALPLSGVVSPFLSSGNTAMVANFLIFALLLSISADATAKKRELLRVRRLGFVLACSATALLAMAARYQVFQDKDYLARDAHAFEADGVKRPQHNPRLNSLAREIPRGTIYDRNGVPLATANWAELEQHRTEYAALGVSLEDACSRFDSRHYPFGSVAAQIVGDLRTGENFHAQNASLVEHDSNLKLQGYQFAELASLVRYRHQPGNLAMARVLARDRNVHLTIDIRLQMKAKEILDRRLRQAGQDKGAMVVMNAATGDVLALVNSPSPDPPGKRAATPTPDELLDRARYGLYPPGSTFKLVTAMAALRRDPALRRRLYQCHALSEGRCGTVIPGWRREIKDDVGDHAHGSIEMERAIAVSCNAYFAQLGVHDVGAKALAQTAALLGISTGDPKNLPRALPFAAYGQGEVVISPLRMAAVAATIAAGGRSPAVHWADEGAAGFESREVVSEEQAKFLAGAMRRVVTEGTARHAMAGAEISFAGKTGTAQLDEGQPHSWFTGFAPYEGEAPKRLSFAVLVEHGGYGARAAAPIAREVMEAAKQLGMLQ